MGSVHDDNILWPENMMRAHEVYEKFKEWLALHWQGGCDPQPTRGFLPLKVFRRWPRHAPHHHHRSASRKSFDQG